MTIKTENYTVITANEGYFLTNNNGIYGVEIILGKYDSPENYQELPLSQWPDNDVEDFGNPMLEDLIIAKNDKLAAIEAYDVSENVNLFYYNDSPMWLDKATRVGLVNSCNSLEAVGESTINIWYKGSSFTLPITVCKQLLSAIEVYAINCYNVTEQHKAAITNSDDINFVSTYDITIGYPTKLHF